ncbi:hypothetical protein MKX01_037713 [Papaver californicum]|nr:hypothetical protein MKX01_037713 [Papaver californicum]
MANRTDGPSKTTTKNSLLNSLINLDTKLSLQIHTLCTPIPRSILKALEFSGDGRFWIPIPIALFFSPLSNNSNYNLRSIFIGLLVGLILDLIFVGFFKYTIRRPRPVYNKGMKLTVSVDHWSFPSGHSSRVWFISFYLYLSSASISGKFVDLFVSIFCLWSAATSISRVLLGRHFVFDVIAGTALGLFNALLVFKFCNI